MQRLRFLLDAPQVLAAAKAFRVKLVDFFGAGRTRREPTLRGDDLQAADGRAVARRGREHRLNRVTGKLGGFNIFRRKLEENRLLFRRGRCIDALVDRRAELARKLVVELGRIAAGAQP